MCTYKGGAVKTSKGLRWGCAPQRNPPALVLISNCSARHYSFFWLIFSSRASNFISCITRAFSGQRPTSRRQMEA